MSIRTPEGYLMDSNQRLNVIKAMKTTVQQSGLPNWTPTATQRAIAVLEWAERIALSKMSEVENHVTHVPLRRRRGHGQLDFVVGDEPTGSSEATDDE